MAGAKTEKASMPPKNTKLHDVPVVEYEPPLRRPLSAPAFLLLLLLFSLAHTHISLDLSRSLEPNRSLACSLAWFVPPRTTWSR